MKAIINLAKVELEKLSEIKNKAINDIEEIKYAIVILKKHNIDYSDASDFIDKKREIIKQNDELYDDLSRNLKTLGKFKLE